MPSLICRRFDHTAQIVDTLSLQALVPVVLTLQADAGFDHSIKCLITNLTLFSLFKVLDLDHLVVIRCAPYGSVERTMSILGIALAHVAMMCMDMPEWAEKLLKNCGSMKGVEDAVSTAEKRLDEAKKQLADMKLAEEHEKYR